MEYDYAKEESQTTPKELKRFAGRSLRHASETDDEDYAHEGDEEAAEEGCPHEEEG